MKHLLHFSAALLMTSCIACTPKSDNTNTTNPGTTTNPVTNQGKGSITLTCNGTTFVNAGNCNYSSVGDCIVVADSNNSANVFTFNLDGGLPEGTKTYPLVDKVSGKENAHMSFARFPSASKLVDWESTNTSGSITLTAADGNKITCTFSNIPLSPSAVYNPDSLNHIGACYGTFTLYR